MVHPLVCKIVRATKISLCSTLGNAHPLAMDPTKTAMLCDSGSVGRNWDKRIVGASAERARHGECQFPQPQADSAGRLTQFDSVGGKMIGDGILPRYQLRLLSTNDADLDDPQELL